MRVPCIVTLSLSLFSTDDFVRSTIVGAIRYDSYVGVRCSIAVSVNNDVLQRRVIGTCAFKLYYIRIGICKALLDAIRNYRQQ